MDEKEKDYEEILPDNTDENSEDVQDGEAVPAADDSSNNEQTDGLDEKDGVRYETNDNWTFDAEAPSLNDNIVLGNDDFEIEIDEEPAEKEITAVKTSEPDIKQDNSNQIVISKEPLKFIPLAIFVAAVIAVLTVLGVRYYTVPNGKEGDMMNPGSVVAEIDGTKVSVGMFNYYYSSIISYYEQYAAYGYFDLDTSTDYSKQFTTDDEGNKISWAEFFKQECLEEIKQTTAYYTAGKDAGVTLTKAQQETIDSQIESLKTSASEEELSLDEYITSNFGQYCSEDTLRLMLEQYYITVNYKGMVTAQSQYSDEEIDKYFNANQDEFKQIRFSYLAFDYDTTDDDSEQDSVDNAKSYMSKMTDEESVKALVPEVYADYIKSDAQSAMSEDSSLSEEKAVADATETYENNIFASISGSESPFDDETTQWLFSDDTAVGSTNYYIDESAGYIYVILKSEKAELLDDNTYTVRHILIMPEDDSEDLSTDSTANEYTDEQWAAAEEKANTVLDKFNKGDKTEYSFALLAEEYSSDTASTSASSGDNFGGLYESVTEGEMVSEFEDWSFDASRKYGDTEIVKSDYGYHIMFFVSSGPEYKSGIVSDLRNQKLEKTVDDSNIRIHDSVINEAVEIYNLSKELLSEIESDDSDDSAVSVE